MQAKTETTVSQNTPDLSVDLAGLKLANPTMTCSGTCGYAFEYADFMDISKLGAFVTKSITREFRPGNEPSRIVEVRAGMLNAIGLANVGLKRFLDEKVPDLRRMPCPVIVNVAGHSFEDYVETVGAVQSLDCVKAIELNVSCPNVKDGLTFGTHPGRLKELTAAVKKNMPGKPLIVKLSPNVTDIAEIASAVADAGFRTTVFPAARQAAISTNGMPNGKFHGVTTATTPRGSKRKRPLLCAKRICA